MAEYRGLTIRIGADTGSLTASLKAASGAISAAQKQARLLKQSLNLDPGNSKAAALYIGELQSQASAASAKLRALRDQMREVGDTSLKTDGTMSIKELAEQTDNAALSARRAKNEYAAATNELATMYTQLTDLSKAAFDKQGKTFNHQNNDIHRIASEYLKLATERPDLISMEEAEAAIAKIVELRQAFSEASDAYDDAKLVNSLHESEISAARLETQIREVVKEIAAASRSELSISLDTDREDLAYISADAEKAKRNFESLDKALKLNPTNMDLVRSRAEALADAQEKASQKVDALRSILGKLKAAGLEKVVQDSDNLAKSTTKAEAGYQKWETAVIKVRDALKRASDQKRKLEDDGDVDTDEYQKLTTSVERLTSALAKAEAKAGEAKQQMDLLHDATEMVDKGIDLSAANADLLEIRENTRQTAYEMSTAFFQAMEQVGQAARSAISEVVTASYDLEDAYTNMLKTVDGTEEQYNELKESAVAASLENPVSADQILNVEALGGQLGFAIDELEEFQRVANGLDISTNMSWEDAATNMAQFANIMGMHHEDVGRYGAAIVDLGNNFATTESDISDMAMRIAGAGATLKLSAADVLGLSAALTSMGLTAEAGGSSISQIMIKIEKAVANGRDGIKSFADQAGMSVEDFVAHVNSLDSDALTEFAKQFGMTGKQLTKSTTDAYAQLETWAETAGYDSASKFADAWKNAPIEALQNIFKGMDPEKLANDESNLSLLLDDLGVSTIRQSDVARRLANSNEILVQTVEAANKAWDENIALDTEVERRNESLSGRMDVVRNSLTAVKTELGEGLAPLVEIAASSLQGLVKVLDELSPSAKTAILAFGGGVAVLGSLGAVAGALYSGFHSLMPLFATMKSNIIAQGGLMTVLSGGIGSVVSSLGAFVMASGPTIAAVGALAAAFVYFHNQTVHAEDLSKYDAALTKLDETNKKYADSARSGTDAITHFNDAANDFPQTMGLKDVTQELKDFNQAIEDTMNPVEESNTLLGEYKSVIDQLAGKGKVSADDMGVLEWAISGVNEALGTNFTAQDVLVGKYQDEETEIGNLMSYLDRLIEKRQLEAEMKATQEVYSDALKEQMKMQAQVDAAERKYQDHLKQRQDLFASQGKYYTEEELLDDRWGDDGLRKEHEDLIALQKALSETAETTDVFREKMGDLTQDSSLYDYLVNAFPDESFAWGDALDKANIKFLDFANAMEEAGMGVQDLEGIYHDGSTYFADLVEQSGGDLNKLIDIIKEYNNTHPQEKKFDVDTSEVQAAKDAVGSEYGNDVNVNIVATDQTQQGVDEARANVDGLKQEAEANPVQLNAQNNVFPAVALANGAFASIPPEVNTSINADVKTGEKNLGTFSATANAVPKETNTKSNADTAEATKNVNDFMAILNAVPGSISTILHTNFDDEIAKANTLIGKIAAINNNPAKATDNTGKSATGSVGAAPFIPRHASGYIATGPTLTNNGWVGEDGIEVVQNWATGGAVVPLTNKKYMLPIADAIAAGMISRGAGAGNNTTIEVHLNYKAGDDANKMARDLASAIARVQRTRR